MRTGEAAQRLGLDGKTIRNWMDEELIAPLLSAGARRELGGAHRTLNDDDLRIMSTIRHLRIAEKITDWQEIREYLETGKRVEPPTLDGVTAQTETVSRPYAEQGAQVAALRAERDALRHQLETALERYYGDTSALHQKIGDLREEIGRLKARIEQLEKGNE